MKWIARAIAVTAATATFSADTYAQKTLVVAGYGGSWEQVLRKDVFPAFEAKHGVKIEYTAGNSTDTIAKLQAQKANQVIDVAIVDDGPMYQAIQLGFCASIAGLDKSELYKTAVFKDDKAVAVGQTCTGFMVNTKVFKEKGWPIPTLRSISALGPQRRVSKICRAMAPWRGPGSCISPPMGSSPARQRASPGFALSRPSY